MANKGKAQAVYIQALKKIGAIPYRPHSRMAACGHRGLRRTSISPGAPFGKLCKLSHDL
jgi:hypothetical protein